MKSTAWILARFAAALVALAGASISSFVVGLGVLGALLALDVSGFSSDCDAYRPSDVWEWFPPVGIELGTWAAGCFLAGAGAWAISSRYPLRLVLLAYFGGAAVLSAYGIVIFVASWRTWNVLADEGAERAQEFCDPIVAEPHQIPLGIAVFGVILLAHVAAFVWIWRRRRSEFTSTAVAES